MSITTEIQALSRAAITRLLEERDLTLRDTHGPRRRHLVRWPFPGTIELWISRRDGTEDYLLGTSLNLSLEGCGIRCDERLPEGMKVSIAIHEPEISFHGRAVVRHSSRIDGDYLVGLEFVFDDKKCAPPRKKLKSVRSCR
jgi:hypothetical protein